MIFPNSRADSTAEVLIDHERCTRCGLCVKVCCGIPLYMGEAGVEVDQSRFFGCIACGQCVTVCPVGCITVKGRELSPEDLMPLPTREERASSEALQALLTARRSVRKFLDKSVEGEVVERIIEMASTAPMGLPPSDVGVLVLEGRDKVREFTQDMVGIFRKSKKLFKPPLLQAMRPFITKEEYQLMKTFVGPLVDFVLEKAEAGQDYLFYDAPLVMLFYNSPYSDPADSSIAATYAMLAGESMGLGTCMIGSAHFFLQRDAKVQQKYGIKMANSHALMVIFGYPAIPYRRSIKRTFRQVTYY